MVHSPEWTTGAQLFLAFDPVSPLSSGASGPLDKVDHWLIPFPGFCPSFCLFLQELVVHSKEWTTSSRFFLAFGLIPALFQEARGLS